ncbi:MAG: PadR family transcriptional regulator [Gemmatimonadota bacterium]|jgi:DNA-binding PadR family transcriptional regulator
MTGEARPDAFLPLGNLAFHVLLALGEEDAHGYGIIKDVEARSGGHVSVRSGTLYTTLHRLMEDGLVADAPTPEGASVDRRRKYYRITELGRRVGAAETERLATLVRVARERRLAPERA